MFENIAENVFLVNLITIMIINAYVCSRNQATKVVPGRPKEPERCWVVNTPPLPPGRCGRARRGAGGRGAARAGGFPRYRPARRRQGSPGLAGGAAVPVAPVGTRWPARYRHRANGVRQSHDTSLPAPEHVCRRCAAR